MPRIVYGLRTVCSRWRYNSRSLLWRLATSRTCFALDVGSKVSEPEALEGGWIPKLRWKYGTHVCSLVEKCAQLLRAICQELSWTHFL